MLNWRDPNKEMPKQNQVVWVLLRSHKERGSFQKSAMGMEICCGEASWTNDGAYCRVDNMDELGHGSIGWYLGKLPEDWTYNEASAIAWLPLEEMPEPSFYKE